MKKIQKTKHVNLGKKEAKTPPEIIYAQPNTRTHHYDGVVGWIEKRNLEHDVP